MGGVAITPTLPFKGSIGRKEVSGYNMYICYLLLD